MRLYLQLDLVVLALLSHGLAAAAADPALASQPELHAEVGAEGVTAVRAESPSAGSASETGAPDQPANITNPAVQSASRALLAAEEELGTEDVALAPTLEAFAVAQLEAGEYAAAAGTLGREIELLEKSYGVYDMRLASPLSLLAEVQSAAGDHAEAIETFQRAQHVVHRADGVYSLDQLEYIEKMSNSFVAMKNYAEADRHNRFSFFVSEKKFGPQNPDLVPAILKLADWYRRAGNVRDARNLYERAVRVIENARGKDDPGLIEPLLGLGTTAAKKSQYRRQRESALKRMVAIVDAQPDIDAVDRAGSWAHLGDFYVLINREALAAEAYEKGWSTLRADPSLPEEQAGLFSEPKVLNFPKRIYLMDHTPGTPLKGFDMSLVEYQMEVEFEVSIGKDGRVLTVSVIDLDASPTTSRQIRRYVREARFRPRIVDGKPVRTDGFRLKEQLTIIRPKV